MAKSPSKKLLVPGKPVSSRKSTRRERYLSPPEGRRLLGHDKQIKNPRWWYERICPGCHYVNTAGAKRCPRCREEYPR